MLSASPRKRSFFLAIALASRAKSLSAFIFSYGRKTAIRLCPYTSLAIFNGGPSQSLSASTSTTPRTTSLFSTLRVTSNDSSNGVWYSDPNLSRSDIPKIDVETLQKSSRFTLVTNGERGATCHLHGVDESGEVAPIILSYEELNDIIGTGKVEEMAGLGKDDASSNAAADSDSDSHDSILVWVGERDGYQYLAVYAQLQPELISLSGAALDHRTGIKPAMLPLREFGDRLMESTDAAIHSTANGLIEFHKAHKFCSSCGSPTLVRKVGASRLCSDHTTMGGTCRSRSIYPRIDLASIMLITSNCEKYALLGRKSNWPPGRYSTLAGFLEVGETIEDCCIRETWEESGVRVDPTTVEFRRSQPWPFPRSLMVGFRAKAMSIYDDDGENASSVLPKINFDEQEMEDVRWFEKDYVRSRLKGGSTALMYNPTEEEIEFHIPGKASLARVLITEWALEN